MFARFRASIGSARLVSPALVVLLATACTSGHNDAEDGGGPPLTDGGDLDATSLGDAALDAAMAGDAAAGDASDAQVGCTTPSVMCGSSCTDLSQAVHCGDCTTPCGSEAPLCSPSGDGGYACSNQCSLPSIECDGHCIDPTSDALNCSMCGMQCAAPTTHGQPHCSMGTCGFSCDANYSPCGGDCVDFTSDRKNCGACGHDCGSDPDNGTLSCVNLQCTTGCNSGFHNCSGSCFANDDVMNCGASCAVCTAPTGGSVSCDGTQCVPSCPAGQQNCGGTCVSSSIAASGLHYVDPMRGTDDSSHGYGLAGCAYKTLTYALTQATGPISLAAATYSAASGETFPIVLKSTQQLQCKQTSRGVATLQGKGTFAPISNTVVVAFTGSQNALDACIVDGTNSGTGPCVQINANGTSTSAPHQISSSDIGSCGGAAVQVAANVTNVKITTSNLHDSAQGVRWGGTNTNGSVMTNNFTGNGTDIQCPNGDSQVTGSGNVGTNAGKPTCTACASCPF